MTLAVEFIWRYEYKRPVRQLTADRTQGLHEMTKKYKIMLYALAFSTVCIFIRCVSPSAAQSLVGLLNISQVRVSYR